ncbi:MAG TPA: hypothetical protein VK843_05770 [Planctomycetota bacterium]|nr:hypothetical protein [Planctomycetota bacterium]
MKKQYQELLHQYKVGVFHKEHDQQSVSEITSECLHVTEDVLKQKYHYHFHELADADRAEIINMINNYTREAILPPVIEKLVSRQIRLERRFNMLVGLTEQLLELLSQQESDKQPTAKA